MSRISSRGSDQFSLRFPDGMRDRIKTFAAANGRSMNSEIVSLLEMALDRPAATGEPVRARGEPVPSTARLVDLAVEVAAIATRLRAIAEAPPAPAPARSAASETAPPEPAKPEPAAAPPAAAIPEALCAAPIPAEPMTRRQRSNARLALGFPNSRRTSHRNHMVVAEDGVDFEEWRDLVDRGLATAVVTRPGGFHRFSLTRAGADEARFGNETLDAKDFPAAELAEAI